MKYMIAAVLMNSTSNTRCVYWCENTCQIRASDKREKKAYIDAKLGKFSFIGTNKKVK